MNLRTAREMATHIFDLIKLCAEFEARYPTKKASALTMDDGDEAWEHVQHIYDKQREIARLLDDDAIMGEAYAVNKYFVWGGHMSAGQANKIHQALGHLVVTLTKYGVKPVRSQMVQTYQYTISRMLDPEAVRNRHDESVLS